MNKYAITILVFVGGYIRTWTMFQFATDSVLDDSELLFEESTTGDKKLDELVKEYCAKMGKPFNFCRGSEYSVDVGTLLLE